MDKLWEFLRKFIGTSSQANNDGEDAPRRISMFRIIIDPFGMVVDNFKACFLIAVVWALLMVVISFAVRHPYLCLYSDYRSGHYCSENVIGYVITQLLLLGTACCFMVRWAQVITEKKPFSLSLIVRPQMTDLKMWGGVVGFLLFNMVSGLSAWMLYQRKPNPDYQIELLYFTFVGVGLLFPLFAMRFYSVLGFVATGEKTPSLLQIWKRGRGNNLRILFSLGLIFLISVFSLSAFNGEVRQIENKNSFYIGFIVEYLYSLLILLLSAFFINHCLLQKRYLFEREKDGQ